MATRRRAPGAGDGGAGTGSSLPPFEAVVVEHGATVLRVCRALLGPIEADDAWSETFLAALRAYPELRPDSNVRGWLITIAHRKAIDVHRRARRAAVPGGDLPDRAAGAGADPVGDRPDELDDGLRRALAALPPKQRGAVVYRYLADLSYAEVAALLECSPAAARRSASDGMAALRRTHPWTGV